MIRFCDKEVCCIREEELDRQQLIVYFLNGHRNELVCIINEAGKFVGSITYDSLLGKNIEDSIKKDYVIFDKNIWKNGRKYFRNCQKEFGGDVLLPVLDQEHNLFCFAWQDDEADRELRMLDELIECKNILGFKDVYPEFDCVIVHGCNELSYYFVQYLKKNEVSVEVIGKMWEIFDIVKDEEETLDYRKFTVYGEGLGTQEEMVGQRESVSEEFECIDRIYEQNIKGGV